MAKGFTSLMKSLKGPSSPQHNEAWGIWAILQGKELNNISDYQDPSFAGVLLPSRLWLPFGCFYEFGVHFLGGLMKRALLVWVYGRAPVFLEAPNLVPEQL